MNTTPVKTKSLEESDRTKQLEFEVEKLIEMKNPQGAGREELLKLRSPTKPEEIEWRIQQSGEGKSGIWAKIIPYIDARAVIDRLDHCVGPMRWTDIYREIDGGFICTLSIHTLNGWIQKEDACDKSDIESIKGGVSGALKRAAVKWGIGRDLYRFDVEFAEISMDQKPGYHYAETKDKKRFYWRKK